MLTILACAKDLHNVITRDNILHYAHLSCIHNIILSNAVTSEKWTTLHLASLQKGGTPVTILEALQAWMNMSTSVRYSDRFCEGPSCNPNCPDRLTIGRQSSNNWPIWSKTVIACVIVVITVICVLVKIWILCWTYILELKQATYIRSMQDASDNENAFVRKSLYPSARTPLINLYCNNPQLTECARC